METVGFTDATVGQFRGPDNVGSVPGGFYGGAMLVFRVLPTVERPLVLPIARPSPAWNGCPSIDFNAVLVIHYIRKKFKVPGAKASHINSSMRRFNFCCLGGPFLIAPVRNQNANRHAAK